jgi:hypothetical protein
MPGLHELNVSLTKNGYFKVADVIEKHPRHEVLDNIRGTYVGVNLDRAQIANMLSADPSTKELPEEWDEIRNYSKRAIDALVFISILFSHHTFITVFAKSRTAEMRGVLHREDLGDKAYTNVVYSMQILGLCAYIPGADAIDYNLTPLFKELSIGPLVKRILTRKLTRTCWKEPGPNDPFTRTFYEQCFYFGFHHTLGISERQFHDWLEGQAVEVEVPPVLKAPNDVMTVSASLLCALAAKPFVIIAGATGTGKTQTIRSCVKALCPADTGLGFNHVFIPVEAGWTDGRHLLGYRNPFVLPSPVALRAPCEGTSMDISCDCIWTPPVRYYTQSGVQSNCTPNHLAAVKALATIAKCADEFSSATTIRDHVLMQKILPKLHGNRSQVGESCKRIARPGA